MSCPTCGHTMARVCTEATVVDHYHCERCGTMSAVYVDGMRNDYVPKLVKRCRDFESLCVDELTRVQTSTAAEWHRLGIAESINLPGERKPQ